MYGLSRNIIFCYIIELRKCVHVLAPSSDTDNVYEALLDVSGVQRLSGYKFSDSSILSLLSSWHDTTITFVQTDKPIYKPGQKGKLNISTYTLTMLCMSYCLLYSMMYSSVRSLHSFGIMGGCILSTARGSLCPFNYFAQLP